jgi:hypothetical protein
MVSDDLHFFLFELRKWLSGKNIGDFKGMILPDIWKQGLLNRIENYLSIIKKIHENSRKNPTNGRNSIRSVDFQA